MQLLMVVAAVIGSVALVWGVARAVAQVGAAITDWREEQVHERQIAEWRRRAERHRTWLESSK